MIDLSNPSKLLTEFVGWLAAFILLITMVRQVYTQWRDGAVGGVSRWLFVGQIAASLGFTIYSMLVGNMVFVATNALMLLNGGIGLAIDRRNRRRANRSPHAGMAAPATR
ncbi:MAG TPA: hypothetical protein VFS42_09170 [Burkholderiaceae bacterium]|nr:hypothetical protein [Burkholderiaceae bacterium]